MLTRVVVVLLICSTTCYSQQDAEPSKWMPNSPPAQVIKFEQLMIAKISDDGKFVRFVSPRYKMEERTVVTTVARLNEDKTEATWHERELKVPMSVPDGNYRMTVPVDVINAWSLTSVEIDANSLATKLKTPTHVLVELKVDPKMKPLPVDPYYATILKPETIRLQLPANAGAKYIDKSNDKK